ncbi:energy transducer TonB [Uliginosibacterium sp. 31-12]|uniref:energy transducer TonB n=1 Tax=Uliginosibacterium sp. 31-12 TaxID=3062781 RepID=UPI0026E1B6D5|nr:energy transducer TonB [Uliginosibacterium sp. 31-12]MDO6384924.1 energy transducer TonB [Uliginosibacterium sp. 31-12]
MADDEPWPALSEAGVLLELALAADGRPEAVRLLRASGDTQMDQAWLRRLQSAARRAELPAALQGKAFVLELEFLP